MTADPPVRHIVFDIGKVLVHYDPDLPFARLIPDAAARRWFFDHVCTSDWNVEQDRGRTWVDAEAELIGRFPDHEGHIRAFRLHWHEMVPHAYEDTVAVLRALVESGRDVTMLTNWAADTFKEARERFPFLDLPRGVTVSGEVGLIKPQREIYELHARNFGLDPAATLFIDDSPKNVAGAQSAGWRALLFEGAETLKRDLAGLGIAA